MSQDPIILMLKEKGISDDQIVFLLKVLNKVRGEMKKPDWGGAEACVKNVLEQSVQNLV